MDGRNSLLVFPRKLRNKVYGRFLSVATCINDNVQDSLAGQKRNVNMESGSGLLSNLIGDTSVTQRWVVSIEHGVCSIPIVEIQPFVCSVAKYPTSSI